MMKERPFVESPHFRAIPNTGVQVHLTKVYGKLESAYEASEADNLLDKIEE